MPVLATVHATTILPLVRRQFTCMGNGFVVQKHLGFAARRNIWVPHDQTRVCTSLFCFFLKKTNKQTNKKTKTQHTHTQTSQSQKKRSNKALITRVPPNWRGGPKPHPTPTKAHHRLKWENKSSSLPTVSSRAQNKNINKKVH